MFFVLCVKIVGHLWSDSFGKLPMCLNGSKKVTFPVFTPSFMKISP